MIASTFFRPSRARARVLSAVACAGVGLLFAAPSAEASAPQWTVTSVSRPTNLTPGGVGSFKVILTNSGDASSDGSPVRITDELPEGLSPNSAGASGEDLLAVVGGHAPGANFSCGLESCVYSGTVIASQSLVITFPVDVAPNAGDLSPLVNVVRVAGGGAPDAAVRTPTVISEQPAAFGIPPGATATALSSVQAGAHPDLTSALGFNTTDAAGSLAGDPKDTTYSLPPGFAGDLVDTPSCPVATFTLEECNPSTQVGVATVILAYAGTQMVLLEPVFNLSPGSGEAGRIGFPLGGDLPHIQGAITVRPGSYGLDTAFLNLNSSITEVDDIAVTIWGVPALPSHDPLRAAPEGGTLTFGHAAARAPVPFFTNPTSCETSPLHASFSVTSWQEPQSPVEAEMPFGPMTGCDRLTIEPTVETQATSSSAESATGLNVHLGLPQTYDNPSGLATSHLDDATVTLPEGMSLNPSAGSGLGSCSAAQFASEGQTFAAVPVGGCPNDSKIGSIRIKSPALAEEATGSLFVAKPFENPFDSLLALYLVARIPDRGVVVTAAGKVSPDPLTGQLTTTFTENPQLPFSDFTLGFRQGATSPLVTPPTCGTFTANSVLTPWSVPSQQHLVSSSFGITGGVNGGPCPTGATPPFHPGLIAGSSNNAAGHYSPFYIRLSRQDGEQEITHFSIKLPPGVTGKLAGIPLCSDAQVAQAKAREREQGGAEEEASPSCPAASEVGRTLVEAGVGTVLAQAPGKVYLAGPYHGAPISVVAITAAKVGPFDLGTVVVREALRVNPETGEVFVDATGSDPLPHIVDGIPTHLREVRIYMDRPEFVLNPTSCEPTSTASTVLGSGKDFVSEADDNPVTVASRFQAADCAALGFRPKIAFSLKGGTKRSQFPAFKAVVLGRPGDANIARSEVILPKSEILAQEHIGTSCTRVQFNEGAGNGAGCPANSIYGRARATTPILSEPLEGPVYLRSNGGEGGRKVPDLVAALHGQEINIDLVGFIDSVLTKNKRGETVSRIRNRFETVPDAPVTRFTLEMFGGKKGLLVNSTNLCKGAHKAEVNFTAHNGEVEDLRPAMRTSCAKKGKGKKHGRK